MLNAMVGPARIMVSLHLHRLTYGFCVLLDVHQLKHFKESQQGRKWGTSMCNYHKTHLLTPLTPFFPPNSLLLLLTSHYTLPSPHIQQYTNCHQPFILTHLTWWGVFFLCEAQGCCQSLIELWETVVGRLTRHSTLAGCHRKLSSFIRQPVKNQIVLETEGWEGAPGTLGAWQGKLHGQRL